MNERQDFDSLPGWVMVEILTLVRWSVQTPNRTKRRQSGTYSGTYWRKIIPTDL